MQRLRLRREAPGLVLKHQRRQQAKRGAAALHGSDQHADRRPVAPGVDGADGAVAEAPAQGVEAGGQGVGPVNQAEPSAGAQQVGTGSQPQIEPAGRECVCRGLLRDGGGAVCALLEEGRVGQHDVGAVRLQARRPALHARREEIRFDHRDIGQSSRLNHLPVPPLRETMLRRLAGLRVDAPYTLSDMARDAIALLDHLRLDKAHVVGCSMGGMIVQHLAIEHPTRVASMTSIMSSPGSRRFLITTRPRALKTLFSPPPKTADAAAERAVEVFTALGGSSYAVDADAMRGLGRLAFERGSNPRGFLRHFAAICASGNRTKALGRVRAPTLVFHGAEDPLIPLAAGRATAKAIPGARLHVVPGMGHHMPPGVWDEMVSAIMSNIARA